MGRGTSELVSNPVGWVTDHSNRPFTNLCRIPLVGVHNPILDTTFEQHLHDRADPEIARAIRATYPPDASLGALGVLGGPFLLEPPTAVGALMQNGPP